jgi:thiol-disulfide isomerase/thioredoxin
VIDARTMRHPIVALLLAVAWVTATAADLPSAAALFALTLPGVDTPPVKLEDFRGKPLLINFWARWCAPCRKEIPDLAELHARYGDKGLVVIGIAVEDAGNVDSVRDFARAYDMHYTSLIGGMQRSIELMRVLGNGRSGLPFTVIVGKDGRIRGNKLGAMSQPEMAAAVEPLL